jgi:predicted protein tyrosine phosphatase
MFDAQRLAKANPHDLTHVVSLSEHAPIITHSEITYVHLPVEDEIAIPPAQFNAIMDAISNNIRQGKLLLHCGSGISRGPIMAAAYLHCVGYKEFDAAMQDIALLRGFVSPSAILLAKLKGTLHSKALFQPIVSPRCCISRLSCSSTQSLFVKARANCSRTLVPRVNGIAAWECAVTIGPTELGNLAPGELVRNRPPRGPKAIFEEQLSSTKRRGQFFSLSVSASLAACGRRTLARTS